MEMGLGTIRRASLCWEVGGRSTGDGNPAGCCPLRRPPTRPSMSTSLAQWREQGRRCTAQLLVSLSDCQLDFRLSTRPRSVLASWRALPPLSHSPPTEPRSHQINSGDVVVVDYWATWCGPCKLIGPHFAKLEPKYPNVKFVKVDIEEQPVSVAVLFWVVCGRRVAVVCKHFVNASVRCGEWTRRASNFRRACLMTSRLGCYNPHRDVSWCSGRSRLGRCPRHNRATGVTASLGPYVAATRRDWPSPRHETSHSRYLLSTSCFLPTCAPTFHASVTLPRHAVLVTIPWCDNAAAICASRL